MSDYFRIFCIGRNYGEHIQELGNSVPESPIIFIKPASCLVKNNGMTKYPKYGKELNHEIEVVLKLSGHPIDNTEEAALACIAGVALGIDLTLRDVQEELKKKGLPWEKAKAFEGSALIGEFKFFKNIDWANLEFCLEVNGELRQQGNTREMLNSIPKLILEVANIWDLKPGDLIYTGTPKGVGLLKPGDHLKAYSPVLGIFEWDVGY